MNLCYLNPFLRFASKMLYDVSYNAMPVLVSDCRLFYILEGSAQLEIGDACYALEPGCLFYCCAGSRYTIRCVDCLHLFSLNFDLTQQFRANFHPLPPNREPENWPQTQVFFEEVADSNFLNGHLFLEKGADYQPFLERIVQDFTSTDRFGRELGSAELKRLLITLHRRDPDQLPPKVVQVQEYLQTHFAQAITNRELADLVGYHEYYLNRIFNAATGQSLHRYLLNVRLNRAAYLILNTDLELQAIPEQVGFGSYPHFSGYFKQVFGCSPAQYRKQLRSNI